MNKDVTDQQKEELLKLIKEMRIVTEPVGPLHSWWGCDI